MTKNIFELPTSFSHHAGDREKQLFGDKGFLAFTLAHPNRKTVGRKIQSVSLENGTMLELLENGVLQFTPEESSLCDNIVLSAAVHGNETAPIELLAQLVSDILKGDQIVTQNTLIIIANPESVVIQKRFVSDNMNRLFSSNDENGEPKQIEKQRANKLMCIVKDFFDKNNNDKLHYDLHTAIRSSFYEKFAVSPNKITAPGLRQQFELLSNGGIEAILHNDKKSATFSSFSAHSCNALAFTLELGKVKPFGQNNLEKLEDLKQSIHKLLSKHKTQALAVNECSLPKPFEVPEEVIKHTEDFVLGFPSSTENFSALATGSLLAKDEHQERLAQEGERIIFPNAKVAVGQRALLIVKEKHDLLERLV